MFISSLYFWVKQLSLSLARWKVYLGGLSFLDLTLFTEQVKLKSTHNLYNFCKISYTLQIILDWLIAERPANVKVSKNILII